MASIASLPLADEVPTHGVTDGSARGRPGARPRRTRLFWVEALDGGSPVAKVPHRDRLMRLDGAVHRRARRGVQVPSTVIVSWQGGWGAEGGTLVLSERERMRRWRYTWLLDVDKGTARPWFDLNERDRYASPGSPQRRQLPNGEWVMRQKGDAVFFSGSGGTKDGDRRSSTCAA